MGPHSVAIMRFLLLKDKLTHIKIFKTLFE